MYDRFMVALPCGAPRCHAFETEGQPARLCAGNCSDTRFSSTAVIA